MDKGRRYRLAPAGLNAMDVTRIEAGFVLSGVDYFAAPHCLIESRKSSPYEIGLGWTVDLDRGPFVGRDALRAERERDPIWSWVGLEYDWDDYETLFEIHGLPPHVPSTAWRDAIPLYDTRRRQIGQATSGTWSPLPKKNPALATLKAGHARPGSRVRIEVTIEYERRTVGATVVRTPFFNPPRKKA